jgi:NAD(P)-dependent dehydrogenase (short-subunit alcohol dehydrogenase family)
MGTMVVTGASAGIGAAAAVELTKQGHAVLATGRSAEKLAAVHERMVAAAPAGTTVPETVVSDFADLADVRRLAATILERCPQLDVLANNAGLQGQKRSSTSDGFEFVMAVNHLAPFLLTNLLVDRLKASAGRVVTSSAAHRFGSIDFDDLQYDNNWKSMRSYGRSKLANIWFTSELARRSGLPATCFHPGGVRTELSRGTRMDRFVNSAPSRLLMRSPEEGADTLVWLATDAEGATPHAVYYASRKPAKMSKAATDTAAAARFWDESAQQVGL